MKPTIIAVILMLFTPLAGKSTQSLSALLSNTSRPTCNGLCNGSASVTASNGVPPYHYHWSAAGARDTCTITDLCEGNYSVTVSDSVGSTVRFTFGLSAPQPLSVTVSYTAPPTCMGIPTTVSASGGTPPYTGTGSFITPPGNNVYIVSDNHGCVDTTPVSVPVILIKISVTADTACIGGTARAVVSASGGHPPYIGVGPFQVGGGIHYFTVYDSLGCFGIDTAIIPTYPQQPVKITASDLETICASDTVHMAAPSGYASYLWSVTGSTDSFTQANMAGNYYVIVTDQHNCHIESNVIPLRVYPSTPVSISVNGDTLLSFNGNSFQWYFNYDSITGANGQMLIARKTGEYSVAITDSFGCTYMSAEFAISVTSGIENIDNGAIRIYPNPSSLTNFHLMVTNDWIDGVVNIHDETGRIIYAAKIEKTDTEIALDIARGAYLVRLLTGDKIMERKIIHL